MHNGETEPDWMICRMKFSTERVFTVRDKIEWRCKTSGDLEKASFGLPRETLKRLRVDIVAEGTFVVPVLKSVFFQRTLCSSSE